MINDRADYKWVNGDIASVIIDGAIMPLRNGASPTTGVANAKILRGEDPCFLMEAWEERQNILGSNVVRAFDKRLGRSMDALMTNMISDLNSHNFVDSFPPDDAYDVASNYWTTWLAAHGYDATDIGVAANAFQTGQPLDQQPVLDMFAAVKRFSMIYQNMSTETVSGGEYLEEHSLDPDYPFSMSGRTGYFSSGGTDGGDPAHPNMYGGWGISLPSTRIYKNVNLLVPPAFTRVYILEHFYYRRYDGSATTVNKYQLYRTLDVAGATGSISTVDQAAVAKPRLTDAMQRYCGITPGFITTAGVTVEASLSSPVCRGITITGDHTKWW